jgi:purine-nucleoside phosphorylase
LSAARGLAVASGARRDAIGIPVSVLPLGDEAIAGLGRRPPGRRLEARAPVTGDQPADDGRPTAPDERSRPIPPADQPARLAALEGAVRARTDLVPSVGIVLGSGLGGLADDLDDVVAIPFDERPGWPAATAPGHVGRLLLGRLGGVPVVLLQGRFHLYEGNDPGLVVQPVLLFGRLGARRIVLTNAAGGINPDFGPGTLMVVRDHLNLTGRTPLLGPNDDGLGTRFPDLSEAWSADLRERLHAAGRAEGIELAEGIYVGLVGPQYETPAEVRMLRGLGADAVGMSTVLECIAARWAGFEVCGVSLVTNAGAGDSGAPLTHDEVLEAGAEAGPRLARVIRRFVTDL